MLTKNELSPTCIHRIRQDIVRWYIISALSPFKCASTLSVGHKLKCLSVPSAIAYHWDSPIPKSACIHCVCWTSMVGRRGRFWWNRKTNESWKEFITQCNPLRIASIQTWWRQSYIFSMISRSALSELTYVQWHNLCHSRWSWETCWCILYLTDL